MPGSTGAVLGHSGARVTYDIRSIPHEEAGARFADHRRSDADSQRLDAVSAGRTTFRRGCFSGTKSPARLTSRLAVEGQTLVELYEFPIILTRVRSMSVEWLDHLAFACRGRDELEAWELRLSELGIEIGGIVDAGYGSGLSCRDPDNIALEFFAPAL